MYSLIHIIVITAVITLGFILLSYTKLGMTVNTVIFAFLIFGVLIAGNIMKSLGPKY